MIAATTRTAYIEKYAELIVEYKSHWVVAMAATGIRSSRAARVVVRRMSRAHAHGRGVVSARCMASAPGATSVRLPEKFSTLNPQGNKVLLRLNDVAEKSLGGIVLPASEMKKPTLGTVTATGPQCNAGIASGASEVKVGAQVLYSKWGFMTQEVEGTDGETMVLVKEEDLLGSFAKEGGATVEDVPYMEPMNDRVILKVDKKKDTTGGGVVLAGNSTEMKERPVAATVVAVGPGRFEASGGSNADEKTFVQTTVKPGDRVVYFRWAGDALELRGGDTYVVIPERDILGKMVA